MIRRIALRISAQSLVGFSLQQFLNGICTVDMRQQLGRYQAVGQRIVDLMREVDLDIGELPVLFDGDRRRQAKAADAVPDRFRLAVDLREDDRHAEIERFHAGQAERLGVLM